MKIKMILLLILLVTSTSFGQSIATIDYPTTFILHPLMTNYRFAKGSFEKSPILATPTQYNKWLISVTSKIKALRKTHGKELDKISKNIEKLQASLIKLADKQQETISSLAIKFDSLRKSSKKSDKKLLLKENYGQKIQTYENKSNLEISKLKQSISKSKIDKKNLIERIEAPQYTTEEETKYNFNRIQSEILYYAKYAMKAKKLTLLLNSTGMGIPASNKPAISLDATQLAHSNDQQIELYKRLLAESPEPPKQDAPNPDYIRQLKNNYQQSRIGRLKRVILARTALRLVEPDITPRVLVGGASITAETVNYLLTLYKFSEAHRTLVVKTIKEMEVNKNNE